VITATNPDQEVLIVSLEEYINASMGVASSISILRTLLIEENLCELYKSKFTDSKSGNHLLAVTRLQPNYAR
jgi:hypothetical protein